MELKQVIKKVFRTIPFGKKIFSFLFWIYCFFNKSSRKITTEKPFGIFNIELTNHCPMKCVMCPRTYDMTRELGYMEFAVFKKVIDELISENPTYVKNQRVWFHHFGESLLHPEFDTFIHYATQKGVHVCLSLNPFFLTEEKAKKLIAANIFLVYLSLDGNDDESFFQIRGIKNAFEKSKQNILNFLELKKLTKSNIQIILSMINFEKNKNSIKTMSSFWKKQNGLNDFLVKPFEKWTGDIDEINTMNKKQELKKGSFVVCNIPWETITIAWDGSVVPCCFDYNSRYVLGNVKDQKLSEIWNDETMQKLRQEFISNNVTNALCKKCNYLYDVGSKI